MSPRPHKIDYSGRIETTGEELGALSVLGRF
jgi:hypothetical protein